MNTDCRILCKQYVVKKYLNWIFEIFLSMYILTIPMITFMNFTVLSGSLAHAALVVFLTEIIIIFREEKISAINCIIIILSLVSQDLLRADRLYNTFILLVTVFIIKFVKYKKQWKQLFIALFSISHTLKELAFNSLLYYNSIICELVVFFLFTKICYTKSVTIIIILTYDISRVLGGCTTKYAWI